MDAFTAEEKQLLKTAFQSQLTTCISELQMLDADVAQATDDSFDLGKPEDYQIYQRRFIRAFLRDFIMFLGGKMKEAGIEEEAE